MGLKNGHEYKKAEVESGIKDATGAATVVIDISGNNAKLTVDGHAVGGKHGATGQKVRWSDYLRTEVNKVAPASASESKFTTA